MQPSPVLLNALVVFVVVIFKVLLYLALIHAAFVDLDVGAGSVEVCFGSLSWRFRGLNVWGVLSFIILVLFGLLYLVFFLICIVFRRRT